MWRSKQLSTFTILDEASNQYGSGIATQALF